MVAVEGEDPGIWSVGKPFSSVWDLDPTCTDGPCDVSLGGCQLARSGGTFVEVEPLFGGHRCLRLAAAGNCSASSSMWSRRLRRLMAFKPAVSQGTGGDVPFHICGKKWTTIKMEFTGVRIDLPLRFPRTTSTTEVTTTTTPSTTSTTVAAVAVPGGEGPVDPGDGEGGTAPSGPTAPAGVPVLAASLRGPDGVSWADSGGGDQRFVGLALVLLMPFPGELFNRTLDEHYDEVTGWFRRLLPGGRSERSPQRRSRVRGSWLTLGLVLVAGTLLAGLLDPGFGWNRSTGALLLGAGYGPPRGDGGRFGGFRLVRPSP